MKHHLKVLMSLLSFSTKRYLEHRWNTFGSIVSTTLALAVTVVFINVIFSFTEVIHGWNKYEVLFLTGLVRVFSSTFSFLFLRSINYIPNYIRRGELDGLLIKPVNIQFFLSFRFIRTYEILNTIPGLILMLYSAYFLGFLNFSINWIWLAVAMFAGILILYGLYFSFSALAFWFIRFESLPSTYYILTTPLSFPISLLGAKLSFLLTFIIPLGFMVTVPAQIFLNKSSPVFLIFGIFMAVISVLLSRLFWNFALRRYTSASS